MLLECIGNTRDHLSSERAKQAWDEDYHVDETGFKIGMKYIVYGIIFRRGEDLPKYLVCTDEDDDYPVPELAEHFKILDGRIPQGWTFNTSTSDYEGSAILPERMAKEYVFMEKLYDGDSEAVKYFLQLTKTMREPYKEMYPGEEIV